MVFLQMQYWQLMTELVYNEIAYRQERKKKLIDRKSENRRH